MKAFLKSWFFDDLIVESDGSFNLEGGKLVCNILTTYPCLYNQCSKYLLHSWVVKKVLLLQNHNISTVFPDLKKCVRQGLCLIIVHSSNKRIIIKHKRYFLNPNELFILIVALEFSSLVCSGCAALSQQWRTSVSPAALYSQICAKQVEWISCGLPWVATICIF